MILHLHFTAGYILYNCVRDEYKSWIFRNHSDLLLNKYFLLLSMLKTVVLPKVFCGKAKQQLLFEIEIFCIIMNVFAVTLMFLLNKSVNFFQKKITLTSNIWTCI